MTATPPARNPPYPKTTFVAALPELLAPPVVELLLVVTGDVLVPDTPELVPVLEPELEPEPELELLEPTATDDIMLFRFVCVNCADETEPVVETLTMKVIK